MFLFAWRRSGNENDSQSDNAVENGRDYSNFRVFYRSVFSTILVPGTGFFRLEGILGVRWAEKKNLTTSYPHCLQIKAHGPSILNRSSMP